jgi:hypothetical protein
MMVFEAKENWLRLDKRSDDFFQGTKKAYEMNRKPLILLFGDPKGTRTPVTGVTGQNSQYRKNPPSMFSVGLSTEC